MAEALLAGLLGTLVLLLWLPAISEFLCLVRRRTAPVSGAGLEDPRLLFLVPAHDEAGLIGACASSLIAQAYPVERRRVVVVADNCGDRTAFLARENGAEAFERTDPAAPGKPRALAWALSQVAPESYDVCVIIDADSTVDPGFARAVAAARLGPKEAGQAYFGSLNEWDSWLTRLAGVLARGRYEVTYPLKQRVGLNCPLTGNGMCLGRDLLRDGWNAFSLTENWELYADYTSRGVPIRYIGKALLYSQEAASMRQGGTQRRRWLAGRLNVLRQYAGRLLGNPSLSIHQRLDALAELGGPSPVLHAVAVIGIVLLARAAVPGVTGSGLAAAATGSLIGLVGTTVTVLVRHPQKLATLAAFVMLPLYAIWRTLTAIGTVFSLRDAVWRKTSR